MEGSMIDAVMNVAVFAALVLSIVGFNPPSSSAGHCGGDGKRIVTLRD
jgi:hypothetical protein